MKIETIYEYNKEDYREHWALDIEGVRMITLYAPEAEDATISRDLSFVRIIPELMRIAYEAGKAGQDFSATEIDGEVLG